MNLFKIIKKQSILGFTGKINLLGIRSGQFFGEIHQKNGTIVQVYFENQTGEAALIKIIACQFHLKNKLKYIVEAETIPDKSSNLNYSYNDFLILIKNLYLRYEQNKKLKPPEYLYISINRKKNISITDNNSNESVIIKIISDHTQVSDIYKKSPLYEFETTEALITLRRKSAILVLNEP